MILFVLVCYSSMVVALPCAAVAIICTSKSKVKLCSGHAACICICYKLVGFPGRSSEPICKPGRYTHCSRYGLVLPDSEGKLQACCDCLSTAFTFSQPHLQHCEFSLEAFIFFCLLSCKRLSLYLQSALRIHQALHHHAYSAYRQSQSVTLCNQRASYPVTQCTSVAALT